MANPSIQLGTNSNWAIKEDKLLAYKEYNDYFFNKEFDFSRGTSATYVAKDGLIKTAGVQPNIVQNGDFSELGSELVTNGDFATDSDWTKGSGWTISNGKASNDGSVSGNDYLINSASTSTVGKTYKVVFTISDYVQGNLRVRAGQASSTYINANGTYTQYQVSTSTETVRVQAINNFIGSIDNVSVKQVDPNDYWTLGSDWSFGDGKATYGGNANGNALTQSNLFTVSGRYRVKFTISDIASGQGRIYMSNASLSEVYLGLTYVNNQSYSFDFDATATNDLVIRGYNSGGGQSFSISNITVQQIETDTPRIDFTNDTKGHLLLEPSRTNLITYSEDFSTWTKQNFPSNSETTTAPNGDTVGGYDFGDGYIFIDTANLDGTSDYTNSIYIKANKSATIGLRKGGAGGSDQSQDINLTTNWVRFTATSTSTSTGAGRLLLDNRSSKGYGVSDLELFIWGAQQEQGSYATSYIPTTGATATRNADLCDNGGSAQDFNDSEGVLYAEIAKSDVTASEGGVWLSRDTNNEIRLNLATGNRLNVLVKAGGSNQVYMDNTSYNLEDYHKIAIKYKLNDYAVYVDGTEIYTDTSATVPTGLDAINFNNPINARNVQVFTEALTDAELQELTS